MHRATVIVGARPIKLATKACSRQQEIRAFCAVLIHQPVWRTVVIGPGDALAGSYRDLSRRELKVGDRDLGATLHRGRRGGEYRLHHLFTDTEHQKAGQEAANHGGQPPKALGNLSIVRCHPTFPSLWSSRFAERQPCVARCPPQWISSGRS